MRCKKSLLQRMGRKRRTTMRLYCWCRHDSSWVTMNWRMIHCCCCCCSTLLLLLCHWSYWYRSSWQYQSFDCFQSTLNDDYRITMNPFPFRFPYSHPSLWSVVVVSCWVETTCFGLLACLKSYFSLRLLGDNGILF